MRTTLILRRPGEPRRHFAVGHLTRSIRWFSLRCLRETRLNRETKNYTFLLYFNAQNGPVGSIDASSSDQLFVHSDGILYFVSLFLFSSFHFSLRCVCPTSNHFRANQRTELTRTEFRYVGLLENDLMWDKRKSLVFLRSKLRSLKVCMRIRQSGLIALRPTSHYIQRGVTPKPS
jgi:hypothetical protein